MKKRNLFLENIYFLFMTESEQRKKKFDKLQKKLTVTGKIDSSTEVVAID